MRVFWERIGVLYPICRLVGQGLSDGEIANKLNLTELKVQSCIAWMLQFLKFTDRKELVHYASPAVVGMGTA
jgi:DNA-binding NarL/FixJ family response regulator